MVASNKHSRVFRWARAESADSCPIHHQRALAAEPWPHSLPGLGTSQPRSQCHRDTAHIGLRISTSQAEGGSHQGNDLHGITASSVPVRSLDHATKSFLGSRRMSPRDRQPVLLHGAHEAGEQLATHVRGSSRSWGSCRRSWGAAWGLRGVPAPCPPPSGLCEAASEGGRGNG